MPRIDLTKEAYLSEGYERYGVSGFLPGAFLAWDFGDPQGDYSVRPCPKCEGKGYHHGFGEHGHDPDWCSKCGGGGWEIIEPHTLPTPKSIDPHKAGE